MYADSEGRWIETVFDLLSLGTSVVEVVINPANPWAWAGLVGDAFDLIPFVTGLGEGVKGTIGIIGPKRMDYENVMDNLKTLRSQLDGILNKHKDI